MAEDFADLPVSPIGTPSHRHALELTGGNWRHALELSVPQLDKALAAVLAPDPSKGPTYARSRVEHEVKRLKSLMDGILEGLKSL